jgi:mono/diheme cytochrome c family protein
MSEMQSPGGKGGWGPLVTGIAVGVVVIALLVISFGIGYNLGETRAEEAAEEPAASQPDATGPADESQAVGEVLFQQTCGSCHALQAAGTEATVGPDLDALQPSAEQVLAAIANGGTGTGAMPAELLTGTDADEVAAYVEAVAGSRR